VADVHFEGQTFELKTGPLNQLVMTEFFAATADVDPDATVEPEVMLALLGECITEKDMRRFMKLGRKTDEFWDKALAVLKARMDATAGEHPTLQPSGSTEKPPDIPPKSVIDSDAKVFELSLGRVDRYAMLKAAKAG
jgi:hypothetical protein